jgi:hypothetical protein
MVQFVSPASAALVAREGTAALARLVGADGRFLYRFHLGNPERRGITYSAIRHAAAVWVMLRVDRSLGPVPEVAPAALRAGNYLIDQLLVPFGTKNMLSVIEEGFYKIGGNALGILALLEMEIATKKSEYVEVAHKLANYILEQRRPDGDFIHVRNYPLGTVHPFRSAYYTGEVIYALLTLYERSRIDTYRSCAAHSLQLLSAKNYGVVEDSHWMLYALEAMHNLQPAAEILDYSSRIAKHIINNDEYRKRRENTPIACRTEGLLAYLRASKRCGGSSTEPSTSIVLKNIRQNLSLLLRHRDPSGVFQCGHGNDEVRIDYIQHAVASFAEYALYSSA